jgi:anti-sigma B factor antagonist
VVVHADFAVEREALDDSTTLARVQGEIDMATTPDFAEPLLRLAESGKRGLIVDLTDVTFMGASGLHVLEDVQARLRRGGGRLAVVAPRGIPLRVLKLTGSDRALGVVDSVDAARAKLG